MKTVKTIAVCLPEDQIEFIDDVACKWVCSRSAVLKRFIAERMREASETDEIHEITEV